MESCLQPLESLRQMLGVLLASNRFYADRLRRAGVTPENLASLADFSARVGFTGKEDLVQDQAAFPPYGSNLTFPVESYSRYCQTTGTTGNPLLWLDTAQSWEWLLGNWMSIYRAVGVTAADRIYFAFSFGPFLGFWTAFEAAAQLGCLCLPGGGLSSAARLRAMQVNLATVLLCTPTYALHLAEAAQSAGVDPGFLRTLIVAGEPGGSVPEVRARISAAWGGARVIDHYGMTELGPVAYEEPHRPGSLRVLEHSYYPEVIDPQTGRAVPDGMLGELVLTPIGPARDASVALPDWGSGAAASRRGGMGAGGRDPGAGRRYAGGARGEHLPERRGRRGAFDCKYRRIPGGVIPERGRIAGVGLGD